MKTKIVEQLQVPLLTRSRASTPPSHSVVDHHHPHRHQYNHHSNSSGGSGNNSLKSNQNDTSHGSSCSLLKELPISVSDIDAEDVIFYAKLIGIDPFLEPHLLWIAQAGLVSPLPFGWIACEDHKRRLFYHNRSSGESSWDHPNDHHYRLLVERYRRKSSERKRKSKRKTGKKEYCCKTASGDQRVSCCQTLSPNSSMILTPTMSGMSNLHFFDDEDDEFADLLKGRPKASVNTVKPNQLSKPISQTISNSLVSAGGDDRRPNDHDNSIGPSSVTTTINQAFKTEDDSRSALNYKLGSIETTENSRKIHYEHSNNNEEDSIESVEFDIENEVNLNEDDDVESIASLEAFQTNNLKKIEISKEKEDSDPESDHWNSLPDNEQMTNLVKVDPFEDLFKSTNNNSNVFGTNSQQQQQQQQRSQRPMSAKVRQQIGELDQKVNLKKELSILEEEEDDQDEVENHEAIHVSIMNKEIVNHHEPTLSKIRSDLNTIGETSQMGRISIGDRNDKQSHDTKNGINDHHTSTKMDDNGTSRNDVSVQSDEDDFQPESVHEHPPIQSSINSEQLDTKFQLLTNQLTKQIANLRHELNHELRKSETNATHEFRSDLNELKRKYENGQSKMNDITESVDRLSDRFQNIQMKLESIDQRTISNQQLTTKLNDDEIDNRWNQFTESIEEKTRNQMNRLESKLIANQVEELRKQTNETNEFTRRMVADSGELIRSELKRSIDELRQQCLANKSSIVSMGDELRNIEQVNNDRMLTSSTTIADKSALETQIRIVHGSLRDEMSHIIERKFSNEYGKTYENFRHNVMNDMNNIVQQECENRVKEKIDQQRQDLNSRLDQLQQRIDQIMEQIDSKLNNFKLINQSIEPNIDGNRTSSSSRNSIDSQINGEVQNSESNALVNSTVQQCRQLQKTLHSAAKQLSNSIKQLQCSKQLSSKPVSDRILKPTSSRSHENLISQLNHDQIESEDSDSTSPDNTKETKIERKCSDLSDQSFNTRLERIITKSDITKQKRMSQSKSTPDLLNEYNDLQQKRQYHRSNYDEIKIHFGNPIASNHKNENKDGSRRINHRIRDIRSSSNSLISLIRHTGDQLRKELNSLENLGSHTQDSLYTFGPSELIIHGLSRNSTGDNSDEAESLRHRIHFDDSIKVSDENLIRQLRSIRNSVNERLKKMSVIIEQQKTTKI